MTLERRYRRLIRLYPAAWRARYEDEVVGTLLDAAGPGRDSVSPAEAADLVRGAVVQRFRALAAAPGPGRGRATVRVAGSMAAAAGVAVAVVLVGLSVSDVPAEFLLTSLVVAAVPGTGVLYTVSSSISGGWRRRPARGRRLHVRHRAPRAGGDARAVGAHAGRGGRVRGRPLAGGGLPGVHGPVDAARPGARCVSPAARTGRASPRRWWYGGASWSTCSTPS